MVTTEPWKRSGKKQEDQSSCQRAPPEQTARVWKGRLLAETWRGSVEQEPGTRDMEKQKMRLEHLL